MLININDHVEFSKDAFSEIYLAGGCFWGVDAYIKRIKGVYKTECGYANGNTANPTYEDVCRNNTGHAETVKVIYDSSLISLEGLLKEFFGIINPLSVNKQAGDIGTQYRSGIYYVSDSDLPVIEEFISKKQKDYDKPIATEVLPLKNYCKAEEYHQDYLDKNPNGYCHVDLSRFKA